MNTVALRRLVAEHSPVIHTSVQHKSFLAIKIVLRSEHTLKKLSFKLGQRKGRIKMTYAELPGWFWTFIL